MFRTEEAVPGAGVRYYDVIKVPLFEPDGSRKALILLGRGNTERKHADEQVSYMAYYDPLTGLPNRALLLDRLRQSMAQHLRSEQLLAVCYLDLDDFDSINDRFGHDLGDVLLVALAKRLKEALRDGDTIARLGGDELVLLLTSLDNPEQSEIVVRRLIACLERPFELHGQRIGISASFGITLYPRDDSVADGLLRHADQAMYQAKAAGKAGFHFYDTVLDQQQRKRTEMRAEVDNAIQRDELILHYQPRVELTSGHVVGVEALVRWRHPERGLLAAADFLPVIEGSSQEIHLGRWVVKQALGQHSRWREQGLTIPVSINISPNHIQAPGFAESIAAALADHPRETAGSVELEVQETAAIGDIGQAAAVMNACIALGLRFSLDDFGTGYSSLTYFQRLPIALLKVDQHFVRGMLDKLSDLDIVRSVLKLAEALKRPVVAEGVENLELGLMLLHMGCRYAQGYGIARPIPADRLRLWLAEWARGGPWSDLSNVDLGEGRDVELKVAIYGHRRWVEQLRGLVLVGQAATPVPPAQKQCQLGRWYNGIGRARYQERPIFAEIAPTHDRFHELAAAILAQLEAGDIDAARERLPRLEALSAELIEQLQALVD